MSVVNLDTAGKLHDIAFRLVAAGAEMRPATDMVKLAEVFARVGNADLVVDAILMPERPLWLYALIGDDMTVAPATRAIRAHQVESR